MDLDDLSKADVDTISKEGIKEPWWRRAGYSGKAVRLSAGTHHGSSVVLHSLDLEHIGA